MVSISLGVLVGSTYDLEGRGIIINWLLLRHMQVQGGKVIGGVVVVVVSTKIATCRDIGCIRSNAPLKI